MPQHYPAPHPADVLAVKKPKWNYDGQRVPSADEYTRHVEAMEMQGTAKPYEAWVAEVESVKAANAREKGPAVDAPAPPEPASDEVTKPKRPSSAPGRRDVEAEALEPMSVRVKEGIGRRIDRYCLEYGGTRKLRKQEVVSDVLDRWLNEKGF